ncbi:gliding motility-associated C-terminal domain-containing protein [Mangrovimonas sp. TPBH4]|uniref:HYR-like domain-containing protein n=1 Tax=Mangrovimonas sp. TPBH4 TaxID=1645914 RepID=UPI0009E9D89D|nr:gliding motility-associated C-terminal domain-containing protein [Mangrovimonas sp. TPBH4]
MKTNTHRLMYRNSLVLLILLFQTFAIAQMRPQRRTINRISLDTPLTTFSTSSTTLDDTNRALDGCNANDFTLTNFYLADASGNPLDNDCIPGTPQTAYIYAYFDANTNADRYSLFMNFDVVINGVTSSTVTQCLYDSTPIPVEQNLPVYQLNWNCGDQVELVNFYMAWQSNANQECGENPSKCYSNPPGFIVNAPLITNFTYTQNCDAYTVAFTSITTGGNLQGGYTYSWNFGDGGTSTEANPSHTYTNGPGNYNVTLTVFDVDGDSDVHTDTVTVSPLLTGLTLSTTNIECTGGNTGTITPSGVSGGTAPYTYSISPQEGSFQSGIFVNLPSGTYTVTVTDANSCSISEDITISVDDNTPPVTNAPSDLQVEGCVAADVTNDSLTSLAYSETPQTISQLIFLAEGGTFTENNVNEITYQDSASGTCPVVVTRTFTITDDCGLSSSDTQTITIEDTTDPTISVAAVDASAECGSDTTTALNAWLDANGGAVASDNCSAITWTNDYGTLSDDCGNTGSVTVTFTATDACGNFATTDATFTIEDTTAPSIDTVATNLTVECDGGGNATDLSTWLSSFGGAAASDTCGGVTWTNDYSSLSDDCGATGSATVTFTATDDCGNTATTSATFTIEDTTDPTIDTAAADLTVECDGSGNTAELNNWLITVGGAAASDTCGGVTWTNDYSSLSDDCGATGSALVTFTATDDCGNISTTSATFTIEDTTIPTMNIVAADQTVQCNGAGNTDELEAWLDTHAGAMASDNCSDITWTDNFTGLTDGCGETGLALVTFTATDECGNSTSTTALFTILDLIAPTIDTPASDFTVECDGTGNLAEYTAWLDSNGGASASDSCGTVSWSYEEGAFNDDCGLTGTRTVSFTAEDGCGNSVTTSASFIIQDTTDPTFTVPASVTLECDQDPTDLALTGDVTDETDGCSSTLEATFTDTTAQGACASESIITRTWTLTDDCGNTTTQTQTISIEDTTAPTFTVPAAVTIECDQDENDLALTGDVTDEADNCSTGLEATFADATAQGACANEIIITRTWTLTDECGNTATEVQTITIQDTTAPTFTVPASVTLECDQDATDLALTGDVTDEADNCSTSLEATFTDATAQGACANESTITRTWTLVDACGNTTTQTQTISIQDTTAPVIQTTPSDIVAECDGSGNSGAIENWLANNGGATASDNCGEVTWTNDYSGANSDCSAPVTVTFTATDECGNSVSTSASYAIQDTNAPVITQASDMTLECDGSDIDAAIQDWLDTFGGATATDDCSAIAWSNNYNGLSDGCGTTGSAEVTFTATDGCGNSSSTTATFTVQDTTAPTFTVPASVTLECDQDPTDLALTGDVTDETDGCSTDIEATYTDATAQGACANESIITRTWTLTDDCGNTTTQVQTISIQDTTAPTFTVPAAVTIECDQNENDLVLTGDVTDEADNCSTDLEATFADATAQGACANETIITRTWTLTDDCGNTTTQDQTITIQDTTAPTFTVPASVTLECDQDATDLALTGDVTDEADNCSADLEATYTDATTEGECANESTITRTWTLVDACGNTTTQTQTISIQDTTAPVIETTPSNIVAECDGSGNNGAIENWLANNGGATASDNCGEVTWTNDYDGANSDCSAPVTVTFTATDECGNAVSTSASYAIQDTTAPTITTEAGDVTLECDGSDIATAIQDWLDTFGGAAATDDCSAIAWSNNYNGLSDECGTTGSAEVTFTATDGCGNSSSTTATFTVQDTTAPTFTVPASVSLECDQDPTDLALTGDVTDETDGCSSDLEATYTDATAQGACANESIITRTWTLTDDCGNTTTQAQTITIQDTTAPTFTVPAAVTIECDQNENDLALTGDVTDEADNCSTGLQASFADATAEGECANESIITRTWTLTDECGNTTTQVQTITIQDTTAPTFTVPASITLECDQDATDLALTGDVTDEADNCSADLEATYTDATTEGECANESTITRTWTLTDACGNTTTQTQTISIQDTTAPTIETEAIDLSVECDGTGNQLDLTDWLASNGGASATDNCSEVTWTNDFTELSDACGNTGAATVIFTATDACGNTTTTTATFSIEDTIAPNITTEASDIVAECDGNGNNDAIQNWLDSNGGAVAEELCGEVTWTNNYNGATSDCSAPVSVVFTATDSCGNTSTTSASYAIQDSTPPVISGGESLTVECDGTGNDAELQAWLSSNGGATATDDCSSITWSNNFEGLTEACGATGTAEVTFTAIDGCGNESTTTVSFTIVDTTAPTFTVPASIALECDQEVSDLTLTGDVTDEADNCSSELEATFTDATAEGECANASIITRTWTLTDDCGNTTVQIQTITIQDTTAPTFTVPASVSIECDQDVNDLTLTGDVTDEADNCASELEATFTDATAEGECANASIVTRTWTLTDDCGNTTTQVQTITIQDTTAPTFTVPASVSIECDQDATDMALTGDVTDEADNCSSELEATFTDATAEGECANASIITRTWTLTDDCGNTTTQVQTITIQDTTAPTFTVPAAVTIECDQDENDLALTGDVTDEADNCSSELEATFTDATAEGECANASIITRTWTLTDDCGNTTTQVQTITIQDTTAPTFTVPAAVTIECDQDENDLVLVGDVSDEADNCSTELEATYSDETAEGECANASIITRTWTLTDDCGNTTSQVQTITIQDTTAPTFTVPAAVTIECDQDASNLALTGDVTDEADNCSTELEATYTDETTEGECANSYIITRTWTLTDDCGNATTEVQTINVEDSTAPTFTVPENLTVECDMDTTDLTLTGDVTDEADNCSTELEATFTDDVTEGSCVGESTIERTWTLIDECGNTTTQVQTISVVDTTAPELIVELDPSIDVNCSEVPDAPELSFEDACSTDISVVFNETINPEEGSENYSITRNWTVSDDCGNEATYSQIVNVNVENIIAGSNTTICTEEGPLDLFGLLSGDVDESGTWEVVSGNTTLDGSWFDTTIVTEEDLGDFIFTYTITEGDCPSVTEVTVTVHDDCVVLPCGEEDVVISKAVTPNGDSYNEFFTVTGVEECGFTIELQVFNRWGAKIYENFNYQNDWNGASSGSSVGGASKVPSGTYYYIINLKNSGLKPFSGPIYVGTK